MVLGFSLPGVTICGKERREEADLPRAEPLMASQVELVVKNLLANAADERDSRMIPGSGRSPGEVAWLPTPVFLSGESHRQRSLVGYTVHGAAKSQTQPKQLSKHVGTT